jgi:peptidoglycan hydrolase CwlO-like protein
MNEWNEVGHVPFKDKDKIYEQYRALVDKLYKTFNLSMVSKKASKFKAAVGKIQENGIQAVYREREKLVRNYENLLNELHTYENNLGFLNATSKSGNSLLTELNKKMDKLKAEIEVAKEKIRHIDEGIQQEDEKAE